jgi:hypothetical protein
MIFFLGLSLAMAGHALELEYISPERRAELEKDFNSDTFKPVAGEQIKHKKWTCDMYGMRTNLQVKRDVKLYNFKNDAAWENSGAQVVVDYKVEDRSLIGRTDRFEDQVKLNGKGELISRLSLTAPERQVVAYSVCKSL